MFVARITGATLLDQMFAAIERDLRGLVDFISGANILEIDVAVTDTPVTHGLRRSPKGLLQLVSAATGVVSTGTSSSDPASYVNVKATVAGTYNLIVF